MKAMGERLRLERRRLGKTQSDFAIIGGVKRGAQANYESGDRYAPMDYLQGVAAHGVDIQYVITGIRSINMNDVARAGMESFEVEFEPLVSLSKGVDIELLKRVVAEVMNAIKWHSSLHNIDPEIIADVIGVLYSNFNKENRKPKHKDPAILSTIELMLTG